MNKKRPRSDTRLKRVAAPYIHDLGLEGVKIHYAWEFLPCFAECRLFADGTVEIAVDHALKSTSKLSTLRRTLAHECYHVYQHVNGLKRTEKPAEDYARSI